MKRLVLSDAAIADLKDIARRTESGWGKARKRAYLAGMQERMSRLLKYPSLGVPRQEVGPGCRSTVSGRHVIFYRVRADVIEIVRVLHESMDVHGHVAPDPKGELSDAPQRPLAPRGEKRSSKKRRGGRRRAGRRQHRQEAFP